MMKRREFITLLGGARRRGPWPRAGAAVVYAGDRVPQRPITQSFARLLKLSIGLGETGYVEGQSTTTEYRWAEGYVDRLPALARDLVHRQSPSSSQRAAAPSLRSEGCNHQCTIVFTTPGEPNTGGSSRQFNRPGGTPTGISVFTVTLEAKRLELLHELVPKATTIGVLLDPTFSSVDMQLSEVQTAARATGHELRVLKVSTDADIDEAFSILVKTRVGALVVGGNPFLNGKRNKLIGLAAREAIPAIYEARKSTIAGGLMSYGPSITDVYRQLGVYAGRILKGEKPSDLPVLQPTKFELLINLKTAKTLGITVPPTLLARADEVIE